MKWKLPLVCALLGGSAAFGADLAATPPMGWNSWNLFAEKVDDATVRGITDAMVASGMAKAGYVYVNIDDTWEAGRDANGNILTNNKFPDMRALADYVHSKGLKIGIYSSPGPKTCAGYEGSYQHEEQDAKTYAAWGIDYLKYDWCSADKVYKRTDMPAVYKKMSDALKATGRPIVFSLCQYGLDKVWTWGAESGGNLWRTTGDIEDKYSSMSTIGFDKQQGIAQYAGPGHWNDPDMLEIGNGGMNTAEYRTHFSLWAMLAAPLLAGNDIRRMDADTSSILLNAEVIAIDQDRLGKEGWRVKKEGPTEVWMRPLADNALAVGLFNRSEMLQDMAFSLDDLNLKGKYKVRDLWAHRDDFELKRDKPFSATVPAHGVVLVRLTPR